MKKIIIAISIVFFFTTCEKSQDSNIGPENNISRGGSMARFVITQNALYVVDQMSLQTYNISNPKVFAPTSNLYLGWDIETIFVFGKNLFIGSATGMFIYDITDPYNPKGMGAASHFRSCDPVVANTTHAYVTLRGNGDCGEATEGLYIYDIANLQNPKLIKSYGLQTPYGLALNGNILYVTQGQTGLAIFDVSKPDDPDLLRTVKGENMRDVIVDDDLLIAYVTTGISLFDISDPKNPKAVKTIYNK